MEKTHNLEVPGSSPGWSTLKISNLQEYKVADFSFCEQFANKMIFYGTKYISFEALGYCVLFAKPFFVREHD